MIVFFSCPSRIVPTYSRNRLFAFLPADCSEGRRREGNINLVGSGTCRKSLVPPVTYARCESCSLNSNMEREDENRVWGPNKPWAWPGHSPRNHTSHTSANGVRNRMLDRAYSQECRLSFVSSPRWAGSCSACLTTCDTCESGMEIGEKRSLKWIERARCQRG